MGTFSVEIEIGDPPGERFEELSALVDTGSTYTVVPRQLLEHLGVLPYRTVPFRLADGRVVEGELGPAQSLCTCEVEHAEARR